MFDTIDGREFFRMRILREVRGRLALLSATASIVQVDAHILDVAKLIFLLPVRL